MRLLTTLVTGVAVGMMCAAVVAQDAPPRRGGGGTGAGARGDTPPAQRGLGAPRAQMPPEQAKKAWELQAQHVAQGLGVNEEQTGKVVAAYVETRESHAKSMRELMEKMRQDRASADPDEIAAHREAMQKAFANLNTASREKLQAELAKVMTPDQVTKAMPPLGSFNSNWDMMVSTVVGFNLKPDKNVQAMEAMQRYVTSVAGAATATDPDARRNANQDARKTLSETMKSMLSEDQFGQFQRVMGGDRSGTPRRPGAAQRGTGGRAGDASGGRGGTGGARGNRPPASGGRGGSQTPGGSPR